MKLFISILILGAISEVVVAGGGSKPCTDSYDLYDLNTRAYIKTICFVNQMMVQEDQALYCFQNAMRLYTVEGDNDVAAMTVHIQENHPSIWNFYINARRTENGWLAQYANQLLNPAVIFTDDGENCIVIKVADGSFETKDCERLYTFYCQYRKNM